MLTCFLGQISKKPSGMNHASFADGCSNRFIRGLDVVQVGNELVLDRLPNNLVNLMVKDIRNGGVGFEDV